MDIRVLRYYLAVCREGTMSRAARVSHVTQPTLSRQIADLEREMGCTLIERGAHHIALTEKGIYLRRRAEEIVLLADQTEADLMRDAGVVEGDVRIGAGESQGIRDIAALMHDLHSRYPHIRFRMHSGNAANVIERLDRGLIDVAVLIDYPGVATYNLAFNAEMMTREHVGYVLTLNGLTSADAGSGITQRPLHPPVASPIDVAWKRDQPRTLAVEKFIEALESIACTA